MTTISPRTSRHGARRVALFLVLVLPLLGSCGSSHDDDANSNPTANIPVETLYNNGVDALNDRRFTTAGDQFNAVQQNYPFSPWAANAQLMGAYTQYQQNHYTDAITALDQFIQLHPAGRDIAYAYYLRALCYYEQIVDISRDQKGTRDAMVALQEVVTRFPDSAYARDAKLKIDLCRDHLAGKEMDVGRWYRSSTCTPRRSGGSSAWWTTIRPPTMCRRRWRGWWRSTCSSV